MKVIITGGGTGGHIYPAIAIADRIMEKTNDTKILFIGTERGLEKTLVPKFGYDLKFITVRGINRKKLLKNFEVIKEYLKSKKEAKKIIEEFKPDMVIGTGGYVSGPVVKAASELGIKTYIHEQNATPGLTNKMLEKHVNKVFLGFEAASKSFKYTKKHIMAGNPVRDEFFKIRKPKAREILGIGEDKFVILAFGGSQGAGRINKAMLDVIKHYNGNENVEIFFATGRAYNKAVLADLGENHIEDNIHILEYIHNMENYLGSADLVISRSGALAVAEITVCGVPSILIPSPNVTGNHQMFNAKAVAHKGGAHILEEDMLSGNTLIENIENLRMNQVAREDMASKAKAVAPLDASDIIYYNLIDN